MRNTVKMGTVRKYFFTVGTSTGILYLGTQQNVIDFDIFYFYESQDDNNNKITALLTQS